MKNSLDYRWYGKSQSEMTPTELTEFLIRKDEHRREQQNRHSRTRYHRNKVTREKQIQHSVDWTKRKRETDSEFRKRHDELNKKSADERRRKRNVAKLKDLVQTFPISVTLSAVWYKYVAVWTGLINLKKETNK